ncbi:hypothetical protein [Devosia nitrariae]|uniref:Uncharacterized protein n=1 Tax=Devosia nitrariae TaxID=2071872 RepID=A0ABQ5WE62_9HYPH|nr:hypothetical protein [Devosia nitrariae]GLQ58049.1 hypothetical protein GCM10010862_53080 [Devosia nitrariae]
MPFDSLEERAGGKDKLLPMHIAHNSLLTAREKIELLNRMKASATGALEDGGDLGFDPAEVDEAIEVVRRGVQEGVGTQTVLKGDF